MIIQWAVLDGSLATTEPGHSYIHLPPTPQFKDEWNMHLIKLTKDDNGKKRKKVSCVTYLSEAVTFPATITLKRKIVL